MSKYLSTLEEFDAIRKIQVPHLFYEKLAEITKRNIAFMILGRKENEILLVNPSGFRETSIIAGLSEKHIEYIAKHAPLEYKENIISTVSNENEILEILEIAKLMDDDTEIEKSSNQNRIMNIIQYIQDNQIVFKN